MKWQFDLRVVTVALVAVLLATASGKAADKEDGFRSIFDGKTLKNWDGNPKFWKVVDGTITGQTTKDNPTQGNTFITWTGGKTGDFELRLEYRIFKGNSGIQYRSFKLPGKNDGWRIGGYQADFEAGDRFSGILYGERFRGVLANRGDKTELVRSAGGKFQVRKVGTVGDTVAIGKKIKKEDWNEYRVIARGHHFIHMINGVVTCECTDNDKKMRRASGLLSLQLHAGPPMKVQFRKIRLKNLGGDSGASVQKTRKIAFIAGTRSHGYGSHEHKAGCMLLAKALNESGLPVKASVYTDGYPKDPRVLDDADTIVVYADGGGRHPLNAHVDDFGKLMRRGVGLVCIHYGVEIPKGKSGQALLDWTGGFFETNWSVNPHWTANYGKFPKHEITHGVRPFAINDEWYYHMRFRAKMEGVTPILTDLPPKSTLSRKDGPHSGNKFVRREIAAGQAQHMAWARVRPDGGRGFGFTGGHFHWNWGNNNFRMLVLNAIAWTAKVEVPKSGVRSKPLTVKDLEANQDYPKSGNYNPLRIQKLLEQWNAGSPSAKPGGPKAAAVKPKFSSPVVTSRTTGHTVAVDVDVTRASHLVLVVTDGGNGIGCDWADWAEPRLVGPAGETKLTTLKWKSASSQWGQVRVNRNAQGGPLKIANRPVAYGIGTHANSVIVFELPAGHPFTRFKARGGLDNGGTDQGNGTATSVRFQVFTAAPSAALLRTLSRTAGDAAPGSRDPGDAVAGLDVAEGLEATLFAAEPAITSLTNLDIDARGRVWVCEVVNYRKNLGRRKAGDRILILEDTDGDGRSDRQTVYYQGRDIDSAMGICVLGNRLIVSCSPNVLVFTDTDGDDKPDRKQVLFSKTGQPQHDHSAHSFVVGPDGKLYWNFGNTGKAVHDAKGNPVVDLAGNRVVDNGRPYYGGMPFRCDLDGGRFEVLAHNFRNNYEVTVDSFGTVWQSDNDDDGNRSVRINFIMEFGNYGYRDELTGAGWKSSRTGMHSEIPIRHWHQNDPGVVPNLLQTGAGSPTGITVYEGRLLPAVFHGQVIHCDAGPNVVRAYPVTVDGAGYKGRMVDILKGTRDNWFRPADVCVAPDGSLFVTDWYDPGVGGHNQRDLDRGRLFRVAPPKHRYRVPKIDVSTPAGAIAALKNPAFSVRYLGYRALVSMGADAVDATRGLATAADADPRHRARAVWVLGRLPGQGTAAVALALADRDPDLRTVGLRLARQLDLDVIPLVGRLLDDPSPRVRRECLVALRTSTSSRVPDLWGQLARRHDGRDRWYLEALGIAADRRWDACLAAWLEAVGSKWNTLAGRDILWRSRANGTADYLARIVLDREQPVTGLLRYLRALDFQPATARNAAVMQIALADLSGDLERQAVVQTEALARLGAVDLSKSPGTRAAVERAIERSRGTAQFVMLVDRFGVATRYPDLLALAQARPDEQIGVDAVRVLLRRGQRRLIETGLASRKGDAAVATARVLANASDVRAAAIVRPLIEQAGRPLGVRREAVRAVVRASKNGAADILARLRRKELAEDLKQAAGAALVTHPDATIRKQASVLFPPPPGRNNQPLPPITQLAKRRGNAANGQKLYATTATCAKCHRVNGQGKEVGPDLSEIGRKLSRVALLESMLFPSAGISHNYGSYVVALADGTLLTGLMISQTPETVTIRNIEALDRTVKRSEIEVIKKQTISLMPADIQKTMTAQELVDVVEYLATLRKRAVPKPARK